MLFSSISQRHILCVSILALFVTFFASFPVLAKTDLKLPPPKVDTITSSGTTNGNGGGAVICEGQRPELTDFWEAEQQEKAASSERKVTERLKELRSMDLNLVIRNYARNYNLWIDLEHTLFVSSKEGWERVIRQWMHDVLYTVNFVLKVNEDGYETSVMRKRMSVDEDDTLLHSMDRNIGLFTKSKDPQDSGKIFGLPARGCREDRVAVSIIPKSDRTSKKLKTYIRLPEVFKEMPTIDQLALMFGHEVFHGLSGGKSSLDNIIQNTKMSSATERRFNAWLALASSEDIQKVKKFGPLENTEKCLRCYANSDPGHLERNISFEVYPNLNDDNSLLKLKSMNGISLKMPTFAILSLSPRFYSHMDKFSSYPRNEFPYNYGSPLLLNNSNFNIPSVEIVQVEPQLFLPIEATKTGYSVSIEVKDDGYTFIKLSNQKKVLFTGEVKCQSR